MDQIAGVLTLNGGGMSSTQYARKKVNAVATFADSLNSAMNEYEIKVGGHGGSMGYF